jgi:hypothetical protein
MNDTMKTKEELLTESGIDWELFEIENEFSAKAILSAMERYTEQKLNIHGVMQAEVSAGALEGEQLGNEGLEKSVWVGICKQDYIHWSEDILKCRCCGHKRRA